jgi:hypothetical protein
MFSMRDLIPTFLAVFRQVKPRTPFPEIEVKFYPYTHVNNTIRLRDGRLLVRLSDLLESAPEPVIEALAQILIRKLYRKPVPDVYHRRFRRHVGRREIAAKSHLLRQLRGRKRLQSAQGRLHDLERVFAALNLQFFNGLMAQPLLSWTPTASRQRLGHFDPAHNAILISRVFDSPAVPSYALEYVMYHEMLHLRFPVRMNGDRRCVHSREFQEEERRFPRWREAEAILKAIASGSSGTTARR